MADSPISVYSSAIGIIVIQRTSHALAVIGLYGTLSHVTITYILFIAFNSVSVLALSQVNHLLMLSRQKDTHYQLNII